MSYKFWAGPSEGRVCIESLPLGGEVGPLPSCPGCFLYIPLSQCRGETGKCKGTASFSISRHTVCDIPCSGLFSSRSVRRRSIPHWRIAPEGCLTWVFGDLKWLLSCSTMCFTTYFPVLSALNSSGSYALSFVPCESKSQEHRLSVFLLGLFKTLFLAMFSYPYMKV